MLLHFKKWRRKREMRRTTKNQERTFIPLSVSAPQRCGWRWSQRWRRDFIRAYLERDIPALGPRIAAKTLRRFWTILARRQSALSHAVELARAPGEEVDRARDAKAAGEALAAFEAGD